MKKIKEIAMVSAIIGNVIFERLYKEIQKTGHGYIVTAETIAEWSIEFYNKHKKTNWKKVLEENSLKPLSKKMVKTEIICWDDAIIDFAYYKLETF